MLQQKEIEISEKEKNCRLNKKSKKNNEKIKTKKASEVQVTEIKSFIDGLISFSCLAVQYIFFLLFLNIFAKCNFFFSLYKLVFSSQTLTLETFFFYFIPSCCVHNVVKNKYKVYNVEHIANSTGKIKYITRLN